MKKNIVLLGVIGIASTAIALSVVAVQNHSLLKTKASYTSYTITIHAGDLTTTSGFHSGAASLKTDQLKNDIDINYQNISWSDSGSEDGVYLQSNSQGKIYNTIGNEIRSIESIKIRAANEPFTVKWGFKQDESINYTGMDWQYASPTGYTYELNGDKPNYFMIVSGNNTDDLLYEIVITYDINCVEGTYSA